MVAPPIADSESLATVLAAPHAVALLTVPWSGPERVARATFLGASERLAAAPDTPPVLWALLDEEAPAIRRWLASLGIPALAGGAPLGAGSVLWLSAGEVEAFEVSGQSLRSGDIVEKIRSLWQAHG